MATEKVKKKLEYLDDIIQEICETHDWAHCSIKIDEIQEDINQLEQEIRNQVIEEFEKAIVAEYDNDACPNVSDYLDYRLSIRELFEIAESMKGEK